MDGHSNTGLPTLRNGRGKGASLLAGLLLGLAAAAQPSRAQDVGVVTGRVTNLHGEPQDVLVRLLADGDIPAGDAYTDSNGYFAITGLPGGTFTVVVDKDGYKPFRQNTRLDGIIMPRAQVMVVLEPAIKEAAASGPTVAGTNSNRQLSAKHPLPPFDPKAVREFDKGNKSQQEGNSKAALEHYQTALRIDANFFPALNNIGTIYERQGNHAQARDAFLQAIKINPDDGEAYINLGHVLYEEGQYRAAIDQLAQGLQRSPQSAVGNFFLGSAHFKLHQAEQAEPLLKKACKLDPQHMAPAHLQLANLYLQRHDNAAAKAELQTFLQLNPTAPQVPAIKKMLADLAKQ